MEEAAVAKPRRSATSIPAIKIGPNLELANSGSSSDSPFNEMASSKDSDAYLKQAMDVVSSAQSLLNFEFSSIEAQLPHSFVRLLTAVCREFSIGLCLRREAKFSEEKCLDSWLPSAGVVSSKS